MPSFGLHHKTHADTVAKLQELKRRANPRHKANPWAPRAHAVEERLSSLLSEDV
jgi:hypothetical protein